MFGQQHGLLEAVARGVSAREAKQGGHVLPLSEVDVLIAKGAAFDKLAVASLVEARAGARRKLGALAFAGAFCNLFERLQRPGIVDTELYSLLADVLAIADALPTEPSAERARLLYSAGAIKLLDRMGFAPPLGACASCREGFDPEAGEVWLLPVEGTFLCPDCYRTVRRAHPNAELTTARTVALLRFLRREPIGACLALSGTTEDFRNASTLVSILLQQAPLPRTPHGAETILALLG